MLVISMILFKIFLLKFNLAEWIDMPQFSDETKVYKLPTPKQGYFHKFTQGTTEDYLYNAYQNVTYKDIQTEQSVDNGNMKRVFHNIKYTITEPSVQTHFKEKNTINIKYDKVQTIKTEYFNQSLNPNEEILQYLPMDILKSVHQTLQSQPTSSQGKMQFLKIFENTLITEIESRLAQTISASRKKRGITHYDHDYNNDHATGFPSIEGALMAISFLTFAVYLVQLVMFLFKNMNNSASTTTNATLLLGKRKRSLNKFDDDVAILFKSINNFSLKL